MPTPPLSAGGGGKKGRSMAPLVRNVVIATFAAGVVSLFLLWSWSETQLNDDLHDFNVAEDAKVVRFYDYCAAASEGLEGHVYELLNGESPVEKGKAYMTGAAVLFLHGDSTPEREWPHAEVAPPLWDCTQRPLPRRWPVNEAVDFEVINAEGVKIERSFNPDLLPPQEQADMIGGLFCGPGQLSPVGFQQMLTMGRRLSEAYEELVSRALTQEKGMLLESLDRKRSLASMVGFLMTLLGPDSIAGALGDRGDRVQLKAADANAELSWPGSSPEEEAQAIAAAASEHLLCRWCRQVAFPCEQTAEGVHCMTMKEAADFAAQGEAERCAALLQKNSRVIQLDAAVGALLRPRNGTFAAFSTNGLGLTAALGVLLGRSICSETVKARPPFASRLSLERWWLEREKGFFWRVLWNGNEITHSTAACAGKTLPDTKLGFCPESAFLSMVPIPPGDSGPPDVWQ